MLEEYKYKIVNNNQNYNILKITITNNTVCDYVTINIYDLTDGESILVFQNQYYITPCSTKVIFFPLVINNYDDYRIIENFQVTYAAQSPCTQVSTMILYDAQLNDF